MRRRLGWGWGWGFGGRGRKDQLAKIYLDTYVRATLFCKIRAPQKISPIWFKTWRQFWVCLCKQRITHRRCISTRDKNTTICCARGKSKILTPRPINVSLCHRNHETLKSRALPLKARPWERIYCPYLVNLTRRTCVNTKSSSKE